MGLMGNPNKNPGKLNKKIKIIIFEKSGKSK
jgi:hypothetical protein